MAQRARSEEFVTVTAARSHFSPRILVNDSGSPRKTWTLGGAFITSAPDVRATLVPATSNSRRRVSFHIRTQRPGSVTRHQGRSECNRDAIAGFAGDFVRDPLHLVTYRLHTSSRLPLGSSKNSP